jgi:hypothetical protein
MPLSVSFEPSLIALALSKTSDASASQGSLSTTLGVDVQPKTRGKKPNNNAKEIAFLLVFTFFNLDLGKDTTSGLKKKVHQKYIKKLDIVRD